MRTDDLQVTEVYAAANAADAHLVRLVLEDAGIRARVVGDSLGNAAGELPLGIATAPRVWVSAADAPRARELVWEWEQRRSEPTREVDAREWRCPSCGQVVPADWDACPTCSRDAANVEDQPPEGAASGGDFTPLFPSRRAAVLWLTLGVSVALVVAWLLWHAEPNSARGYFERGWKRLEQHDLDGASHDFKRSLELSPYYAAPQAGLAQVHFWRGEFEEALWDLDAALKLDPTFGADYRFRGWCKYYLGRDLDAAHDYERALQRAPGDVEAMADLAWVRCTSPDDGARDGGKAVAFAERANELAKERDASKLATLAAAYAEVGRFEDAVECQNRALALADTADRELYESMLEHFRGASPFRDFKETRREQFRAVQWDK